MAISLKFTTKSKTYPYNSHVGERRYNKEHGSVLFASSNETDYKQRNKRVIGREKSTGLNRLLMSYSSKNHNAILRGL